MSAPTMPRQVAALPRDHTGRPIPWFVARDAKGIPDFRVVRAERADATRFDLCWICGTRRGRHAAFVVGPMCGVNRVAAEPPSHLDCARYAAQACPFLAHPGMRRRTVAGDEDLATPAGISLPRNPGVALVWSSRSWAAFRPDRRSPEALFDLGDPTAVSWWAHGRPATRGEVLASLDSGMPALRELCDEEPERHRLAAHEQLDLQRREVEPYLPAAVEVGAP